MFENAPNIKKELSAEKFTPEVDAEFRRLGKSKSVEKMIEEFDKAINNLENPKFEGEDSSEEILN